MIETLKSSLPEIVSPPVWYMGFWVLVFLPCFGFTLYVTLRLIMPLYEELRYRATYRATKQAITDTRSLPLFYKGVGE